MRFLLRLIQLVFTPFKNREGLAKLKVIFNYAVLALKSNTYENVKIPKLSLRSEVWSNYSKYLLFQLKFIRLHYWAQTPLILAVAGSYAFNYSIDPLKKKNAKSDLIENLAKKYSETFQGYTIEQFENWLITYKILMEAFNSNKKKLQKVSTVAEIGPGFMSFGSLVLSQENMTYFSYDTFEMQLLQKRISSEILDKQLKLEFVPTNLSADGERPLPVPDSKYSLFAYWSFTEVEIRDRERFKNLFRFAEYAIVVSNPTFEGTDNFEYLQNLGREIAKEISSVSLDKVLGPQIPSYMKSHRIFLLS